ncbi:TerB family tellurite resistance protein [Sneathiella chinensis]|uniref:Molecular chaperone DjlA n=1 Tax=Sneathiella chinensis TaxID=349750 RepID=A0ABQ5U2W3_9PROT|nr:TerB family tellurite resistance protein [Sneathiella chinensis]GLQ05990.1 molecular chaperone DjlA [Sneathiella chinensis]
MAIWGKIFGGAAGLILGGPLGALVGGLAGHVVDKYRQDNEDTTVNPEDTTGLKQVAFTIAVIALGAKLAKADGVVTRDEITAFKRVFRIPPNEEKNVGRVFNMARQNTAGYEEYARQVERMFRGSPEVMEDLLHGLFTIAMADGVLHPDEDIYLQNIASIFGFNESDFDRIRSYHSGEDARDPYRILGVERGISDQDLKKAYRTLIRENHPDKVIAEGLPQEFVDVANEKLAKINAAYDQIARQREI